MNYRGGGGGGGVIPHDEMFDIIVANGVLGYLGNSKSIYEFARVLKSGGSFLFTMRTSHFSERGWKKAIEDMNGKLKVTRKEADV